jgi:hypothetical protein
MKMGEINKEKEGHAEDRSRGSKRHSLLQVYTYHPSWGFQPETQSRLLVTSQPSFC